MSKITEKALADIGFTEEPNGDWMMDCGWTEVYASWGDSWVIYITYDLITLPHIDTDTKLKRLIESINTNPK